MRLPFDPRPLLLSAALIVGTLAGGCSSTPTAQPTPAVNTPVTTPTQVAVTPSPITDVSPAAGSPSPGAASPAAGSPAASPAAGGKQVKTASGLAYEILVEGNGVVAKAGDTVLVHYTGWLENGEKFDSSVDRGTPFDFKLGAGEVIPGWDEGVAGMKVGEKRKLTIPSQLGYGERGAGGKIPPNATLVFEVELLGLK